MPDKSTVSYSEEATIIKVLSKFLYDHIDDNPTSNDIKRYHHSFINKYMSNSVLMSDSGNNTITIESIPWASLLDRMAKEHPFLKVLTKKVQLSNNEILYICAMLYGISSKEYGMITGVKSHYNISWSIRLKLKIPPKSTNLRNYLKRLQEIGMDESLKVSVQK